VGDTIICTWLVGRLAEKDIVCVKKLCGRFVVCATRRPLVSGNEVVKIASVTCCEEESSEAQAN
jgi:hypothetical protein